MEKKVKEEMESIQVGGGHTSEYSNRIPPPYSESQNP